MIHLLPLTIESLVAILLLLTILYCVRLNSQIKRLKADEKAMQMTVGELVAASETAERAIAGLKTTAREADETLGERLRAAEQVSAEIARQTEAGNEVISRIAQIVGARGALSGGAKPPEPKPAAPAAPDPHALVAAAQAFAERARARIKGRAA